MNEPSLEEKFLTRAEQKQAAAEAHADNVEMLLTSVVIQQARVYDVMLALLLEQNSDAAKELREMHEAGELWCPPPSFVIDEEETS